MNKYIFITLLAPTILFTQPSTTNSFKKLTSIITTDSIAWATTIINNLNSNQQLSYLNFLAILLETDNDDTLCEKYTHCMEYISAQPEAFPITNQFLSNVIKYIDQFQGKTTSRKSFSQNTEAIQTLVLALEKQFDKLGRYIGTIYYKHLYEAISKTTSSTSLLYMFDKNGLIPEEKRTKILPQYIKF
jgi:hypothetical protein